MAQELWKAHEEATTKNVIAIKDHSNDTRKLLREVQEEVRKLREELTQTNEQVASLRGMLANLQGKIYQGGT